MSDLRPPSEHAVAMVPRMGMTPKAVGLSGHAWRPWVALLLAAGAAAFQATQSVREGLLLRAESAAVQSLRRSMDTPAGTMSWSTIRRHEALVAVAQCLALPWGDRLAGLEQVAQGGPAVQLWRLELSAADARLALDLRARDAEAQSAYDVAIRHALPGDWVASAQADTGAAPPAAVAWRLQSARPEAGCRPMPSVTPP